MARIVITSWGSAGDLNPYLAVGRGLQARGHDVVFAVEEMFEAPLHAAGLRTYRLSGEAKALLEPISAVMFTSGNPFASTEAVFLRGILPTLRGRIAELRAACDGADLLVSSAVQIAASFVADLTGIPWASLALVPQAAPSPYLDGLPLPPLPTPVKRAVNRAAWKGALALLDRRIDPPLNAVRAEYGLAPIRHFCTSGNIAPGCCIVACSPAFIPRPPDWPATVHLTGFCFHDGAEAWREPDGLAAFLDADGPVVALSSGSMAPEVEGYFDAFYRAGVAGIRAAGARALVIGAPAGALPDTPPADVYALPFAPFSRVYPRCAAVVHHGGIGTTAQGLRAGVPALVVPWGVDQFSTAIQVKNAGAGRYVPRKRFVRGGAAGAIRPLLADPRYRIRARAIAARIAAEDGVGAACDVLEGRLAVSGQRSAGSAVVVG